MSDKKAWKSSTRFRYSRCMHSQTKNMLYHKLPGRLETGALAQVPLRYSSNPTMVTKACNTAPSQRHQELPTGTRSSGAGIQEHHFRHVDKPRERTLLKLTRCHGVWPQLALIRSRPLVHFVPPPGLGHRHPSPGVRGEMNLGGRDKSSVS